MGKPVSRRGTEYAEKSSKKTLSRRGIEYTKKLPLVQNLVTLKGGEMLNKKEIDGTEKFYIRDGFENMDFVRVTEMLATAFWSVGIKLEEVKQGARYSALVVGAFDTDDRQIGYARAVSDKTRFAYIMDVFIDENFRKQGIGQAMVKHILEHPDLKDVYQWVLITKDAQEVYKKLGFQATERGIDWMEIRNPRPR